MKALATPIILSISIAFSASAESDSVNCNCGCLTESEIECICCHHLPPETFTFEQLTLEQEKFKPDSLITEYYRMFPPMVFEPRIFSGYRTIYTPSLSIPPLPFEMDARADAYDRDRYAGILYSVPVDSTEIEDGDDILLISDLLEQQHRHSLLNGDSITLRSLANPEHENAMQAYLSADQLRELRYGNAVPRWLSIAMSADRIHQNIIYRFMTEDPSNIQYALWDLPEPPRLPEEDKSFAGFLKRLDLPAIETNSVILPETPADRINWLHVVGGGLQLSQAYISSNWYQGGNNYLAVLFNFNWNVSLNTVYHPNLLFVSDLSYKLSVNSNPKGSIHKYSIAQDQFQYTLKTGVKAFKKWFYSLNLLFKTQFFTAFAEDSYMMNAKFLSPSEFNVGLGMTYNTKALKDRLSISASIAPLSYNLKACPSMKIDHVQFNILPDRKTASKIGSNAEVNLQWNFTDNISWKSRLFLFSDYHYFQADWENTFNFAINRFLSTQLYVYPRFDSSSNRLSSRWRYWQLKEILSFGLSYTFSTKP